MMYPKCNLTNSTGLLWCYFSFFSFVSSPFFLFYFSVLSFLYNSNWCFCLPHTLSIAIFTEKKINDFYADAWLTVILQISYMKNGLAIFIIICYCGGEVQQRWLFVVVLNILYILFYFSFCFIILFYFASNYKVR